MAVQDYSTTAASNTAISGIDIAESCAPSGINNAIRQMMADVKAVIPKVTESFPCQGRITLTTGTPVTTADVTAATTVRFAPFRGNQIALFDGTNWYVRSFSELSLAVPATTSTMYDLWVYDNSGTAALEALAWTNDTTRATALTTQDGVLVKTGATTRRYVGSFRTTGVSGQTEDSYAKRHVWNYYNRVMRPMKVHEATNSWTYTTATIRQANNSAANQIDFIIGVSEDLVHADVLAMASNDSAGPVAFAGIGLDSTTAATGKYSSVTLSTGSLTREMTATYDDFPGIGRHYFAWLEYSGAAGTTTWYGDGGTTTQQAGISGWIMG